MARKNPEVTPRARRLITLLLNRADDYAWMGAQPPSDQLAIEKGYIRARRELEIYIEELEARKPTVVLPEKE